MDYEPIDWVLFRSIKQDVVGYFIKMDEFGKSEMDYFVDEQMDFGKDEELPIGPVPPVKTARSRKIPSVASKPWAPTRPRTTVTCRSPSSSLVKRTIRAPIRSTKATIPKPKVGKFIREGMGDEVALLEREELAMYNEDDGFGVTFDLEL